MLKTNKSVPLLLLFVLLTIGNKIWGQNIQKESLYIFDKDSLVGFDEEAARRAIISEKFLGAEFKVRMFQTKRTYINDKYHLWPRFSPAAYVPDVASRNSVVPGCTNEDFEAATSGTISANNAISGWLLSHGTNSSIAAITPSYNSCNLLGCCSQVTSASAIRTTPFVDSYIGTQYPIYSVFGTAGTNSTAAAASNTQITSALLGNKIIRINDSVNNYSIEKLSKTFAVTSANALFQFAFISVFATGHTCCDAGSFRIRLYTAGSTTPIPCPTFSVSAPSQECSPTPGGGTPAYLEAAFQGGSGGAPVTVNSLYIYNPWQISSIDLTPYINSSITIEIILTDCTAGGHFGYCYFDAQCGPMTIYGNGTAYAAGTTSATVPTCGAAGATLCAADGLGPYSWAGPGVVAPYTTPSMANQCFTTNLSGTYTLYMNPAGSCAPLTRVISTTITPAPLLVASVAQAVCGSTTAIVTLTPSGSAAVPSSITWSPAPQSPANPMLTGTYPIPTGSNSAYVVTITATDPLGCLVSVTPTIDPAAPIPTFTITNISGSSSITCSQPFVHLKATTTYTYGTLSYTWQSANTSSTSTDEILAGSVGIFTITGQDPVSMCSVTHTYAIGINTIAPTAVVSPSFQNITCVSTPSTVSITATPTLNTSHNIYSPGGVELSVPSYTAIYLPGAPGLYIDTIVNNVSGCYVVKTFSVASSDNYPTLTVTSANNFTVGCLSHSLSPITIFGETTPPPGGGSVTYTVLAPSFTGTVYGFGPLGQFNLSAPGTYTAIVLSLANNCQTKIPFSIIQYTAGPDIQATVPQPILSCNVSSTTLTAVTANTNVAFSWSYPGPSGNLTVVNPTVAVNTTTNTSSTLVANYTLTILNNDNGCSSSSVVPVHQNLFPPKAIISAGATFSITCSTQTAQISNNSVTGITPASGFPTNQNVIADWYGPTPQLPSLGAANYTASVPGTYTLIATDLNNGCTSQTTTTVFDNRIYPVVTTPGQFTIDCGSAVNTISLATTPPTGLVYHWSLPPNVIISGTLVNVPQLPVTEPGEYGASITNTNNGCTAHSEVTVISGSLEASFTANQTSGYAPFPVTFSNTSHSSNASTGTGSISSVWSFGNGTTLSVTPLAVITPTALYTQSGTYTITLYAFKGSCHDTAMRTVSVDIPSKLEVPNVFTPNGDGVNDIFFLKVTNLTDIDASIYDRWGHKVYSLNSTTGNIAWDGTTQTGSKASAGVYFYTIKGTGKDNKSYDDKGTITLYR
jgi:gliding motility-associated-like protein